MKFQHLFVIHVALVSGILWTSPVIAQPKPLPPSSVIFKIDVLKNGKKIKTEPRFSISLKSRCVNRRKFSGQIEGF